MPLLVTPRQLAQRADFYHQLASMVAAGLPLVSAIETLSKNPPARAFRQPLANALQSLHQGETLTESMARLGHWIPSFDLALIEAGERSGRLDASFRLLSRFYEQRAQLTRRVISDLAYPALIVHLAILIFPIQLLTGLVLYGQVGAFLVAKLSVFGIFYGGIFLLLYACQGKRGEHWRAILEKILHRLPLIGSARRTLALARLSAALEGLLNAGVPIIQAWELAAASSGSVALHRTVATWRPRFEQGVTPAEMLRTNSAFPEMFSSLYATAEVSGQIDQTLRRLADLYEEEGARKLHLLAEWAPRLVYIGVLVIMGYKVVTFWTGYYSNLSNLF